MGSCSCQPPPTPLPPQGDAELLSKTLRPGIPHPFCQVTSCMDDVTSVVPDRMPNPLPGLWVTPLQPLVLEQAVTASRSVS